MKVPILIAALCGFSALSPTFAQQKLLSIEDAVSKGRTTLAPERLSQLSLIPESDAYAYVGKKDGKEVLIRGRAGKTNKDTVLTVAALWKALHKADSNAQEFKRFPFITWKNVNTLRFPYSGKTYAYAFNKDSVYTLFTMPSSAENTDEHPKTSFIAYTKDDNLYVFANGKSTQITQDGGAGIVYGKAVHRNEFGIEKGTFWSPNGRFLAFYRMDESMVSPYGIYELDAHPAKTRNIRYPMAGAKSHEVTLGVYDTQTGKTHYLKTGEPKEQYLTNICWTPDESGILIAVLNRGQNHMKLNLYKRDSGELIRTIFEEKHDKYVEPEHPAQFIPGKNDQFIWQSERDGFNHLYVYDLNGKMIRQLTRGLWLVTAVQGIDPKGKYVYFQSNRDGMINQDVYRVSIDKGDVQKISENPGVHTPVFSSDYSLWIDSWSNTTTPRVISLRSNEGKNLGNLLQAPNPLKDYKMPEMRSFTLRSEDGYDLYCRMFLPVDFDSTKKYPVLQYLYGGPHLQLVTNSWLGGADMWLVYMAQQGFVVFSMDNHGSSNRGRDFEQATFRNLGKKEMEDQLLGANYLKKLPYVDAKRMSVYGWSFGGFLTTTLMLKSPETFAVAVAGGPVIDWSMYEIMYTERYMDTPQENPDGFKETNLLNHVDKLKGRLLQIHGTSDDVVLWQHSLLFQKACVEKGKLCDYYVYPEHLHNVTGPDRVHLMRKITQYIQEHLR